MYVHDSPIVCKKELGEYKNEEANDEEANANIIGTSISFTSIDLSKN